MHSKFYFPMNHYNIRYSVVTVSVRDYLGLRRFQVKDVPHMGKTVLYQAVKQ